MSFDGAVALVTGGGSGIGRATSVELASRGASVAVLDVREDAAKETVDILGSNDLRHVPVRADVTSPDQVAAAVDAVRAALGGIDFLVNAAGIPDDPTPCHELPVDQWNRVVGVDLTGAFLVARAAIPDMLSKSRGAVVNVASMAAVFAGAGGIAYTAAKHGLAGLTKRMAADYGPRGINVNAVCPGYVATPMALPYQDFLQDAIEATPARRWAEPMEIAKLVAYLLSEDASYIHGAVYLIDGGATLI
jgi:3-oxoacyl-[acyl-carrier protein] reductase